MNKEIGILFKPDMIRAILAGRKTQTRRIINPQPDGSMLYKQKDWWWDTGGLKKINCRYGEPGDHLYVKETFIKGYKTEDEMPVLDEDGEYIDGIWFKATDPNLQCLDGETGNYRERVPWKSPLFLKKEDARIWLRNTDVSVERLQDISEGEAIAEGIEVFENAVGRKVYNYYQNGGGWIDTARGSFRSLIQSIHGPEVWEENPFVFVINFEVLSTTGRP